MKIRLLQTTIILLLSPVVAFAEADFSGVWMLNGPGKESEIQLTQAGLRIQSNYDLLSDDPSLACVPASTARIWANPNSGIKIQIDEQRVLISYELFDLRREIPIGDASDFTETPSTSNLQGEYFKEMGSSIASVNDTGITIRSINHGPGYIRTSRGIPQSAQTETVEELRVEADLLHITHTHIDPVLYQKPIVLEYSFRRTAEADILFYDCTDADYDWFNELNADKEEGE